MHTRVIPSRTFVRFLLGGGTSTLVHWAAMWGLLTTGCPAPIATALGALCGACTNYLLQYHVTFRPIAAHRDTLPGFVLVSVLSLGLNSLLFHLAHFQAGLPTASAQGLTSGLVALCNYLCFKRLVFHDRSQSTRQ